MEEAGCTDLKSYVFPGKATKAVTRVTIPGQGNNRTLRKLLESAHLSCASLIEWLSLLAKAGFTLMGNFGISDFAVTYFGQLKGKRQLLHKVRKVDKKGTYTARDMASAAQLIKQDICSREVPRDLAKLLYLPRHFKKKDMFIVTHHCSLYDTFGQEMIFSSMYARFMKLNKLDKKKWRRIVKKLPYCIAQPDWGVRMSRNIYLQAIFEKKEPQNRIDKKGVRIHAKAYGNGGEDQLRCRRNGYAHLPDYAVDLIARGSRSYVELYSSQDIGNMYSLAGPVLLSVFQSVMADEGEIGGLGWHEPSGGKRLK